MSKRAVPTSDDEHDDKPHTSTLGYSVSNKRAKTTSASLPPTSPAHAKAENDEFMGEGEVDEDELTEEQQQQRDEDDQELSSEDEQDEAEQAQARRQPEEMGRIAEGGVIKRVELQNFMCHTFVDVSFEPSVNFLVGHNGSGKSAVLAGITMALGGSAKATSRASSNKSFVKDGQQYAVCRVEITNKGSDAYHPAVYGPYIIIERRLNFETGGSYKIKDHKGKVIDTRKTTLDTITDHFNIQVDNPLTVLTQDAARQFLSNSTTKQKYEFFLRGTQLAQLTEEYEIIRASMESTTDILARKAEVIPELKEKYKAAKKRAKEAEQGIEQIAKLETLQHELAWSFVDEMEEAIVNANEICAAEARTGTKIQLELEKIQAVHTGLTEAMADIQEAQGDLRNQGGGDETEKAALIAQISANVSHMKELRATSRSMLSTIQNMEGEVQSSTQRIKEEKRRILANASKENQHVNDAIAVLNDEIAQLGLKAVTLRRSLDMLPEEVTPWSERLYEVQGHMKRCQEAIETVKGRIRHLQSAKGNPLLAFGQETPALMAQINAHKGWKQKLVGPLGLFVKLKDPGFAPVLESFFTLTLNAFVVSTNEDRKTLMSLVKKVKAKNPVIQQRFDNSFSYSSGEPQPQLLTIRRVLQIDDAFVEQVLINSLKIERVILVQQRSDGDTIMRQSPQNVNVCLSKDMFRVGGISGGSSSASMPSYKASGRLAADNTAAIAAFNAELQQLNAEFDQHEQERKNVDSQLTKFNRQSQQGEQEFAKIAATLRKMNGNVRQLNDSLVEDEPSNVDAYENVLNSALANLEATQAQYGALTAEIDRLGSLNAPLVAAKEVNDKAESSLLNSQNKLATQLSKHLEKRAGCDGQIRVYTAKMLRHEQQLKAYHDSVEVLTGVLAQRAETAAAICERPIVAKKKSPAKLEVEIKQVTAALREREKRQGGTSADIAADLARCKDVAIKAVSAVEDLRDWLKAVQTAYDARIERWSSFRTAISARARMQFLHHLANRGFTGALVFDHEKMLLDLRVSVDSKGEGGSSSKGKAATSLSGGEKSFSTICLLLTMWEAVGCPIRCLDEYDVFMDAVNRRVSMKMMIQTAKTANNTQFILITPQSVSKNDFKVNIVKMPDPGRGQGTLAFGVGAK